MELRILKNNVMDTLKKQIFRYFEEEQFGLGKVHGIIHFM